MNFKFWLALLPQILGLLGLAVTGRNYGVEDGLTPLYGAGLGGASLASFLGGSVALWRQSRPANAYAETLGRLAGELAAHGRTTEARAVLDACDHVLEGGEEP